MSGKLNHETFLSREQLTSDTSEDETEYILKDVFNRQAVKGYSVITAAVFITSLMAGMGVLALPHALAGTGWYGLALITLACVNSWYSATILGRSWIILEERWEEYRGKFRYPYPAMGQRSVGSWMRYVVTITLDITLIGVAVVYILLSAQIAQSIMQRFILIDYNTWIIILAAILCPLTWFGSLENFWFAAVLALLTAAMVCYSLLISVVLQGSEYTHKTVQFESPTFSSFSLAFGTILFSFGGVFFFPTIQNDMARRQAFNKASVLGFAGLLLLYMPITIVGYAVYGSNVPANILYTVENNYLRIFIEASLAVHILLAFLLVLNPVAQEFEDVLKIESSFNYKRCLVRSLLVFIVLLIAYTIPHFDKIMNLIGGSTMTLLTFIFPPMFYIFLNYNDNKLNSPERISNFEMTFLLQIMLVGIAGGTACTYFATIDVISIFFNKEKNT